MIMADLDEADDRYSSVDVESILSRVERRPLTFHRKRSLYRAPEFVKRLSGEETVNEATDVRFEGRVDGFPKPVIRWFKDDEEIVDHVRIHCDVREDGSFTFYIDSVTKGDEAAYRCRAENVEGSTSSTFFLSVKGKPKSPRRSQKTSCKRTVSYPPMFPTIVEKVEEEEKAAKETEKLPPSPLTDLYNGITLKTRHTWPEFLGDWAFNGGLRKPRTGSAGSIDSNGSFGSEEDEDMGDGRSIGGATSDDVFEDETREGSLSNNLALHGTRFFIGNSYESFIEVDNKEIVLMEEDKLSVIPGKLIKKEQNNNETNKTTGKNDLPHVLGNGIPPCMDSKICSSQSQTSTSSHAQPGRSQISRVENGGDKPPGKSVVAKELCEVGNAVGGKSTSQTTSTSLVTSPSKTLTSRGGRGMHRRKSHEQLVHPLGKNIQEVIFILCLWTFTALCLGIPCEKFILFVLGLQVIYTIASVFDVCG